MVTWNQRGNISFAIFKIERLISLLLTILHGCMFMRDVRECSSVQPPSYTSKCLLHIMS